MTLWLPNGSINAHGPQGATLENPGIENTQQKMIKNNIYIEYLQKKIQIQKIKISLRFAIGKPIKPESLICSDQQKYIVTLYVAFRLK